MGFSGDILNTILQRSENETTEYIKIIRESDEYHLYFTNSTYSKNGLFRYWGSPSPARWQLSVDDRLGIYAETDIQLVLGGFPWMELLEATNEIVLYKYMRPTSTGTLDFGNPTYRFRSAYLSNNITVGGSIISEIENLGHQEVYEHFVLNLMDTVAMTGGAKLMGNLIVADGVITKPSASVLMVATAAGIGAAMEIYGRESHNPDDYTYYQFEWKWNIDAVTIENNYIGLMDADFAEAYSVLLDISATPGDIQIVSTDLGGAETTDNITVDITVDHVYLIKIKAGELKFYIDDVLKATHTTNVPDDVPAGLMFINYMESQLAESREWSIDYDSIRLGRSF